MPKRHYRSIWISDIHLGLPDCKAGFLLDFLEATQCEQLYLLGDVIDLWDLGRRQRWPAEHSRVLAHLINRAASGTRVMYIPGNHDERVREFAGLFFGGIEIRPEWVHRTADGRRLLLVHGDGFDAEVRGAPWLDLIGDGAYDLLLFINRWVHRARRLLGLPYWSAARELKTRIDLAARAIARFEHAAAREAAHRGLDGIVCGHIHQAELRSLDGVLYCNDGDWVESCTALVEHADGRLEILHWADEAHVTHREHPVPAPAPTTPLPAAARRGFEPGWYGWAALDGVRGWPFAAGRRA